ncbi:hypothetical protein CC85DRAFT_107525 [Cutaneotrichosporon oleaginosum]|uniref:Uncharacterized protein n=1 Tax=Cutaneotrichosporon oleaginosum TaxID=879819 RepID=A0A0J0XKY6_9TREE|nr:uncharacterized protein CC85DRAFT_107525 [Cutaneotrichosporon oleaginosum]KLT41798.1 hypothetical protein CC85DRAFT_107525 [Cutaneotrichosporon oleaginosum]TXT12393.1 hypothetical protein COLE_02803 [Cutaneotrichosporon oleaginosum]
MRVQKSSMFMNPPSCLRSSLRNATLSPRASASTASSRSLMLSMLTRGRRSHVWKSFLPSPVMVVSRTPGRHSLLPVLGVHRRVAFNVEHGERPGLSNEKRSSYVSASWLMSIYCSLSSGYSGVDAHVDALDGVEAKINLVVLRLGQQVLNVRDKSPSSRDLR